MVLRALKLGDLLTGIPALRALARAFPDHERVLVTPARFAPLLSHTGMHRISDSYDLAPLDRALAGADVAVDLHGRGPESHALLLDLAPSRLVAWRHPEVPESSGAPVWRAEEHEVARWCRLLEEYGVPADPSDLGVDPRRLPSSPAPGCTVVHPGAASGARRWPADRFAEVARREAADGRRVVITGGPEETELAHRVARLAGLPSRAVVAGRTGLVDLFSLVAGADRVVCGDTGIAHVATALATPSVVLFGPVPPSEWGPPPSPRHVALWAGTRGDPHGETAGPGLLRITVDEVTEALAALADRGPAPDRGSALAERR